MSFCSIGYPLVYMGFDATCYFSGILRLRTQKAAESESDLHLHLLQHPLPPYAQLYAKPGTEGKQSIRFIHVFITHLLTMEPNRPFIAIFYTSFRIQMEGQTRAHAIPVSKRRIHIRGQAGSRGLSPTPQAAGEDGERRRGLQNTRAEPSAPGI